MIFASNRYEFTLRDARYGKEPVSVKVQFKVAELC